MLSKPLPSTGYGGALSFEERQQIAGHERYCRQVARTAKMLDPKAEVVIEVLAASAAALQGIDMDIRARKAKLERMNKVKLDVRPIIKQEDKKVVESMVASHRDNSSQIPHIQERAPSKDTEPVTTGTIVFPKNGRKMQRIEHSVDIVWQGETPYWVFKGGQVQVELLNGTTFGLKFDK